MTTLMPIILEKGDWKRLEYLPDFISLPRRFKISLILLIPEFIQFYYNLDLLLKLKSKGSSKN